MWRCGRQRSIPNRCSVGAHHASAGTSVEENHRSSQIATAVSSGSRSEDSHTDRADHASRGSEILMHSFAAMAPTQGMKYDAINGFTLKPARRREMMIARPAAVGGRE